MNEQVLWFTVNQCLRRLIEVIKDFCQFRVPVLNNDGSIESFPFNDSICCANGKSFRGGMFTEPCEKQTISICFTPITVVTQIEKYIKILCEEDIKDSKYGPFYLSVMWRTPSVQFLNDKLKGVTSPNRILFFKRYQVMNTKISGESKVSIRGIRNLVWRPGIYLFKG